MEKQNQSFTTTAPIIIEGAAYSIIMTASSEPPPQSDGAQKYPPPQPMEFQSGVIYVNPRQYARILKRREARQKLMNQGSIPATRSKYLHESRHKHATKRARTHNGRFGAKNVDIIKEEDKINTDTVKKEELTRS